MAAYLDGRGVPSMDDALREVFLRPIHQPFKELVNAGQLRHLIDSRVVDVRGSLNPAVLPEVEQKLGVMLRAMKQFSSGAGDEAALTQTVLRRLEAALRLARVETWYAWSASGKPHPAGDYLNANLTEDPALWAFLFGWVFIHVLGETVGAKDAARRSRSWIEEWQLGKVAAAAFRELGLEESAAWSAVRLIAVLTTHQRWFLVDGVPERCAYRVLESLLKDGDVQQFLQVNRFQDILWFNGEAFDALLRGLFLTAVIQIGADPLRPDSRASEEMLKHFAVIQDLQRAGEKAEFRLEKLLEAVKRM